MTGGIGVTCAANDTELRGFIWLWPPSLTVKASLPACAPISPQRHPTQGGSRPDPGLAVVLVGEDPASQIYVRNKGLQAREAGMNSFEHRLPADTSQTELLARIAELNRDPAVNGILVQPPLPRQIDPEAVIEAIAVEKDVDDFIRSMRAIGGGEPGWCRVRRWGV